MDFGGVLLLLLFFVLPVGLLLYFVFKIESKRPHGRVDLLQDDSGNYVLDKRGKPLVVDEHGKVVSYEQGVAHMKREIGSARAKEGCLGVLLGLWMFNLLKKK